ncbi:MAG: hypothetical protein ABIK79_11940 [Chloroflexota bacterium]|nr:hypothetical protein [Anaerolineae bacterium]
MTIDPEETIGAGFIPAEAVLIPTETGMPEAVLTEGDLKPALLSVGDAAAARLVYGR